MAGILSKGIKLSYSATSSGTFAEIPNLQECPELGGAAEKVDVTTLADGNYKYINGIKDFGDLAFTFLYDNSEADSNYRVCKGLEDKGIVFFQVEFPDGTQFAFSGEVSVATSAASVNAPLQFTLNITLNSDIDVTNPQ